MFPPLDRFSYYFRVRWLYVACFAGCASAGTPDQPGQPDAGGTNNPDANEVTLDGSMDMPDAHVPQTRTLSQTTSDTVTPGNTIACGNAAGGWTSLNNYYRVFDLASFGITTPFTVSKVTFKFEQCDKISGSGTCTNVAVRVGTYGAVPGATLDPASISILASNATVPVPEGTGGTVDAPVTATIQPGQRLLVEIDAPDGQNVYKLYMGSNTAGETAPGYIMAPATGCEVASPTNISQVAGGPIHLVMTVTGTY